VWGKLRLRLHLFFVVFFCCDEAWWSVAVAAIADRPPHRSVRAALPHTALTLDDGVEAKFHFAHAA
jgi:hypothetical protein